MIDLRKAVVVAVVMTLLSLLAIGPSFAYAVYVNPSVQTGNLSPDGTYVESNAMQDVAQRLMTKLQDRGFAARNSGWMTLEEACADSNAWGADLFVALHSNAMGGGWTTAHGTEGFCYGTKKRNYYDLEGYRLSELCVHKCVEKFSAWGRGYDRGTHVDYPYYGYNLYVLANTNATAALIEGLFHDNWDDLQVLASDAGKDAYAAAIFEAVCQYYNMEPYPLEVIVDDADNGFSCSANWGTGNTTPYFYGIDYRFYYTGTVDERATWTPNLPESGNWEVFVWWNTAYNRSTAAPYIVNYNGGSQTVYVDQLADGGHWVSLGTYPFAAGTSGNVQLSPVTTAGSVVIADAVRFARR